MLHPPIAIYIYIDIYMLADRFAADCETCAYVYACVFIFLLIFKSLSMITRGSFCLAGESVAACLPSEGYMN